MVPPGTDGRGNRGPHQLPHRRGVGHPQRLHRVRHPHVGCQPSGPREGVPEHHGCVWK